MKRAAFFFDAQNLFRAAKSCFGYYHPNFDPKKLINYICTQRNYSLHSATFYTGVPTKEDDEEWNYFWSKKLLVIKNSGIGTFHRPVRYNSREFHCPRGHQFVTKVGSEKGVDVRLALDMVRASYDSSIEAIVVFSQDQDLNEAVKDIAREAAAQKRTIEICSAYPYSASATKVNRRGVSDTNWIKIEKADYDKCIDPIDYRKPKQPATKEALVKLSEKFSPK